MSKFWTKKYRSKYTGKEIDDAVGKAESALQNPMTASGDIIVGGTNGAAERLGKGTDGQVLKMVSGSPAWGDDGGMSNPMTTAGDIIIGSIEGAPARLPKGTQGQVLTMGASFPEWAAAAGGGSLYMHTLEFNNPNTPKASFFVATFFNNSATDLTIEDVKSYINGGVPLYCDGFGISGSTNYHVYKIRTTETPDTHYAYDYVTLASPASPSVDTSQWTQLSINKQFVRQIM